jgi:hypothetical protein
MLAYTLKEILELVPEALPLVKEAHINEDMPLGNRDSCIATALQMKYHEHIHYKPVDVFALDKIASAVKLYDVQGIVEDLTDKLVKAAAQRQTTLSRDSKAEYFQKQAAFQQEAFDNPERLANLAQALFKEAQHLNLAEHEIDEKVLRYSGHALLSKEAAISSLAARYHATKNADFVKIATALDRLDTFKVKPETVQDLCTTISTLDKEAGLQSIGFDFYKEAFITKEALTSLNVKLCDRQVPYEKIARAGRDRISQYIGEDLAQEMDRGPMNTKYAFEALPRDLQKLVCSIVDNV